MENKTVVFKANKIMMHGVAEDMDSNEEVVAVLDIISTELNLGITGAKLVEKALQYTGDRSKAKIHYVSLDTIAGMLMITLPMTTEEDELDYISDMETIDGILSYVYNTTYSDCSELGYTFYKEINSSYKRIG